MGGLTAAIRLARRGNRVTIVESREQAGGLAAALEIEGFRFDAGPYILLDRPGLDWACRQIDVDVERLSLQRIEDVYETEIDGQSIRLSDSLDRTSAGLETRWPGSGGLYRRFVADMQVRYARLQPLQCAEPPRLLDLVRSGAWRDVPFLMRSLRSVLRNSKLPGSVAAALGIWTHVAGQTMEHAPSALSLVPAVIHRWGCYYPSQGIGVIPETLLATAQACGVRVRLGTKVKRIRVRNGAATGVELTDGEFLEADAVISNVGLGTYLHLLDEDGLDLIPVRRRRMLQDLPLQSPGVCVYLAVKGRVEPPYLRFRIQNEPDGCRLLVTPAALDPTPAIDGWHPARLIAPLHHRRAEQGGEKEQREFLERVLAEEWWQRHFTEHRVLATRIPQEWGSAYELYRNSMNPVMTPEFMRAGRLAHRSPWIRKLYLTGSGTHPGQWVSFCMVSGVLTADRVVEDGNG